MKKKEISPEMLPVSKCPGKLEIPTDKEKECLDHMRSIKARVKELKALTEEKGSLEAKERGDELSEINAELEKLKSEWKKWEEKREKAARERMIFLGHED